VHHSLNLPLLIMTGDNVVVERGKIVQRVVKANSVFIILYDVFYSLF
jgi:hypothetical protein